MDEQRSQPLGVLWGKSDASGAPNLLLQHLLDTAAVAELIWDRYLAPGVKARFDCCCGGQGRALFTLVCGLHDVGKATPAFQAKNEQLATRVRAIGLTWPALASADTRWYHPLAGVVILKRVLGEFGWDRQQLSWIQPLIAGHHGMVPAVSRYRREPSQGHGRGSLWACAQRDLVVAVAEALAIDLTQVRPGSRPTRAVQLAIAGAVVMADWIASGDHFPGIPHIMGVSMTETRRRAERAWEKLDLRGGWRDRSMPANGDLFPARFGWPARPLQTATMDLAESMPVPGLLLVEAPMGEGKTEASLGAAEVLAARFGADGVFVGMPTQATSDAMFERIVEWAERVDPSVTPGLLHGKRRFNRLWYDMQRQTTFAGIDDGDDYGMPDAYGTGSAARQDSGATTGPCQWFLGPKRGLLMPVIVGTIDQLLHAATRTRHVMLRHLGLVGRVVILDEVHAYDVYMMQFLTEALRWLGDAGVPVVLLSATLPPATRAILAEAYLQGVLRQREVALPAGFDVDDGYPVVRAVTSVDGVSQVDVRSARPWRASIPVMVEVLGEGPTEGPERVVAVVRDALTDGGCALVVRNTVGRAQETYQAFKQVYCDEATEVVLLHARLAMGDRVDRTAQVLGLLGPPGESNARVRPFRLVVVATQLAEQSFDVDVDLLVTDLAPVDLLLQRVGRLHRHDRPTGTRPPKVNAARVVVAGMSTTEDGPPMFPGGSEYIYHRHPLLRAASLVLAATEAGGWSIPAQVPDLVKRGYGEEGIEPAAWSDHADQARAEWLAADTERGRKAERFLLAGPERLNEETLAGLHEIHTRDLDDDDAVAAVVRDGPETVEVVMVRRRGDLRYTLDGRSLGVSDTAVSDPGVAEAVVQSTVRLPPRFTREAKRHLHPLSESGGDAWLGGTRVLEFDDTGTAVLGGRCLTYDRDLGLLDTPAS